MSQKESVFKTHRLDIIVISLILIVSLLIILVSVLTRVDGAYVEVSIDGATVGRYSLAIDGVYSLNGGTNTLTVKGGVAYMSYSNCPDHTCENTGKVKYVGQTIVCLPNRLSVTVVGNTDDSVDFMS
jgi:hypothetical protein